MPRSYLSGLLILACGGLISCAVVRGIQRPPQYIVVRPGNVAIPANCAKSSAPSNKRGEHELAPSRIGNAAECRWQIIGVKYSTRRASNI